MVHARLIVNVFMSSQAGAFFLCLSVPANCKPAHDGQSDCQGSQSEIGHHCWSSSSFRALIAKHSGSAAQKCQTHPKALNADDPINHLYDDLTRAGIDFYWIHGSHDVDREHWYDNTLGSAWSSCCLHSRILSWGNLRIAGLGGHFIEKIWHPERGQPRFAYRHDYLAACGKGNRWRGGLPRKVRGAIWWEDIERLWDQEADILITHEAPTPHRYGHSVISELAHAMGARLIVHGHLHEAYEAVTPEGIPVIGLAQGEIRLLEGADAGRS